MQTINPYDESVVTSYEEYSVDKVDSLLDVADKRYWEWRRTTFTERAELMNELAAQLRKRADELATLMAVEMGKPVTGGLAEVEKCAWVCEYYAQHAEAYLSDTPGNTDDFTSFVTYQPIGIVLAVMPWNFPLWQVFRFAAPAVMAGNVGILKHASNVCGSALEIETLFRQAGFPDGVFTTLLISSGRVEGVIRDSRVKAVTLTGSTAAGKAVAAAAGKSLKKTVLELGGSDAYVVLADANIEKAAASCATSRMINSGQSCIAAKRFIVEKPVVDQFTELFVDAMKDYALGDPRQAQTNLGPQARVDLRDELHGQVERAIQAGARIALGGNKPAAKGAGYPATVLCDVSPGNTAFDEELFGPVAAIAVARDENHAIELANHSVFGLGGAVFTEDLDKGRRFAREELEAGAIFVNSFVKSDPRLPFGGIKESGYGRELSEFGIREFVNIKTVAFGA